MAVITVRGTSGSTSTQSVTASPSSSLLVIGPAQSYTATNTSTGSAAALSGPGSPDVTSTRTATQTFNGHPDFYRGLFILENASGSDGNRWYRWDQDQLMDVNQTPPTTYLIGVE